MHANRATLAMAAALMVLSPRTLHAQVISGQGSLVGFTWGLRFGGERPSSMFAGIEASTMKAYRGTRWAGAYSDVVWDFGKSAARLTVGPEGGWLLFGADGGLALELGKEGLRAGFALRPVLTTGVVGGFLRWEHLWGGQDDANVGEIGGLLKYPVVARDLRVFH